MKQRRTSICIENVTDFNLTHTLECGQSFRWRPVDGWYYGVVDGRLLRIRQEGQKLLVESSENEDAGRLRSFLRRYLDLDRDLPTALAAVDIDPYIHRAIETYWGMRILNQDLWECMASFILSQNNNVPRIKGIIRTIARRFGDEVALDGYVDYTFPTPQSLAEAGVDALYDCRMGYRAPYLWSVSASIAGGQFDIESLRTLPYLEAKRKLMQFKGVGEKVADCICLFSLGHMEALPIDVWMKRIIEELYLGRKASIREIRGFTCNYFGRHIGYAQQYLFHYARTIGLRQMKTVGACG
jgi:N-glycosylase/DNA lyase